MEIDVLTAVGIFGFFVVVVIGFVLYKVVTQA